MSTELPFAKAREIALFYVYDLDALEDDEDLASHIMHLLKVTRKKVFESKVKAIALKPHLEEIDQILFSKATAIREGRLVGLELAILRLAIYELCFEKKLAPAIIISEALRLLGKFGDLAMSPLVHAVLDALHGDVECSPSLQQA